MNSKFIKTIGIITAFLFLCETLGWCFPDKVQNSSGLSIPRQYGRLEAVKGEEWFAEDQDALLVILIKDAHCVYEAQKNIENIMDMLVRDYQIDLVCVEGAAGSVDTAVMGVDVGSAVLGLDLDLSV